jgi:hypothetical protein
MPLRTTSQNPTKTDQDHLLEAAGKTFVTGRYSGAVQTSAEVSAQSAKEIAFAATTYRPLLHTDW